MYRVTYEQGNDYHCNCCRQTWTETEDFDDIDDMIQFLIGMKDKSIDRELEEIREIKDEDLTEKYSKIVDEIMINNNKIEARRIKLEQLKKNLKDDEIY
jgi:hypothetical protein